jgi:hypothetical protein
VSPLELLSKYRHKGVLIDTNLLIGYLIGSLNPQHLHNCRATKAFSVEDFELLNKFIAQFRSIVTTPHVLTEVSNLAGKLPESLHIPFRTVFQLLIDRLSEESEPSKAISVKEDFLRFGLTDTAISMIAPGRYLVLTDELALAGMLNKRGVHVLNFNHLRSISW